jgi:[acyl-carrier-protein] S-malonyltransferase
MIAIVCPGQGAQTPGFFAPWLEIPEFKSAIEKMQAASGFDLIKHGTASDADTIRDTAVAQPLIVAAGIATAAVLFRNEPASSLGIAGVSGHSVGEITAAAIAGIFSTEQAIKFVKVRADAMADAAAIEKTSMAAVVGGEQSAVESRIAELGLEPANYNGSGQIVAAGSIDAIAALQAEGPAGARVIPLQVAGAFHTRYMSPAVSTLGEYANQVEAQDPTTRIWTNAGGRLITSGTEFKELLVKQVSNPVRWDMCMASMLEAGVTAIIEVSPAGTLTGLAKRAMPGVEALAVKTPENIEAALELINNHR